MINMNTKIYVYYFIFACLLCVLLIIQRFNQEERIENLNKQIELLECYKENYLIMADSLDGIHNSCFKIGTK